MTATLVDGGVLVTVCVIEHELRGSDVVGGRVEEREVGLDVASHALDLLVAGGVRVETGEAAGDAMLRRSPRTGAGRHVGDDDSASEGSLAKFGFSLSAREKSLSTNWIGFVMQYAVHVLYYEQLNFASYN